MEEELFRSGAGISISRYLVSRFLSTSDMLDAMPRRTNDDIDRLVAQWGEERPDLDLVTMARVARLIELGHTFGEEVSSTGASYGISIAEGAILFALRRSGAPYRLAPSQISEALLVPSGTLTSRLDRLEARGAIRRVPPPADRPSMEGQLPGGGRQLVDGGGR